MIARDYLWGSSPSYLILNAKMGSNPCFLFGIGLEKCRAALELAVNNTHDKQGIGKFFTKNFGMGIPRQEGLKSKFLPLAEVTLPNSRATSSYLPSISPQISLSHLNL